MHNIVQVEHYTRYNDSRIWSRVNGFPNFSFPLKRASAEIAQLIFHTCNLQGVDYESTLWNSRGTTLGSGAGLGQALAIWRTVCQSARKILSAPAAELSWASAGRPVE